MYLTKPFRVRAFEEIAEDVGEAGRVYPETERVFLLDGDAMTLSAERLLPTLELLKETFPRLRRVGAYSNASSILDKSDEDLRLLREAGLGILYFGLESGDAVTLERIVKGATCDQIVEAVVRSRRAGYKTSVMALLGIAGRERWREHAGATAEAVSAMAPRFFSLLTVTPVPGTGFHEEVASGRLRLPQPAEVLEELELMVSGLACEGTVFRCNHASNYLPLRGRLPQDKERLLSEIAAARRGEVELRPEWLRGL
jgi:radical SAM superfamily enzyme YgiQ (UPF0313 family)